MNVELTIVSSKPRASMPVKSFIRTPMNARVVRHWSSAAQNAQRGDPVWWPPDWLDLALITDGPLFRPINRFGTILQMLDDELEGNVNAGTTEERATVSRAAKSDIPNSLVPHERVQKLVVQPEGYAIIRSLHDMLKNQGALLHTTRTALRAFIAERFSLEDLLQVAGD